MKVTDKEQAEERQEDTDPPIRLPLLNTAAETGGDAGLSRELWAPDIIQGFIF